MRDCLLVLACIVAATMACIPMKTPNPGMPATPAPVTPPPCPTYPAANAAQCAAARPTGCDQGKQAPITPTVITCDTPGKKQSVCILSQLGAGYFMPRCEPYAICKDGEWYTSADGTTPGILFGNNPPSNPLVDPHWACARMI